LFLQFLFIGFFLSNSFSETPDNLAKAKEVFSELVIGLNFGEWNTIKRFSKGKGFKTIKKQIKQIRKQRNISFQKAMIFLGTRWADYQLTWGENSPKKITARWEGSGQTGNMAFKGGAATTWKMVFMDIDGGK